MMNLNCERGNELVCFQLTEAARPVPDVASVVDGSSTAAKNQSDGIAKDRAFHHPIV